VIHESGAPTTFQPPKQVVGTPRLHLSAFVNRPIIDVDSGGEVRHICLTHDSDSGV